ncbi:MAG: hypothetical protein EOP62_14610 [Sphingomonadales bacterium]|nr:MAG: hypothetical protein EOP62_14610 [Sphingomonadales bacterium]
MKRLCVALAATMLLFAPEAGAQAGRVDTGKAVTSNAISAQMASYGQWLQRLTAAQMVGLSELQSLRDKWQNVAQATRPIVIISFRAEIAKARAAMLRSDELIRALDRPKFPLLDLAPDLLPDALIGHMLKTSANALELVDSFGPMLDAMLARDGKAADRAALKLLDAAKLLVDSQALLGTAMMATIDKDTAQYDAMQFDMLLYRSAARLIDAAGVTMRGGTQPEFHGDMERIAAEIDGIIARGTEKVEAAIADAKAELDEEEGDSAMALLLRKSIEMDELERRSFTTARAFAAALRALPKGAVSFAHIQQALNAVRIAREAMDAISTAQNDVLAREG